MICATTVTTIHHLVTKALGREAAGRHLRALLSLFAIAPVNRVVLENALAADFNDFEDGVVHEAARHAGAEYIVTRNLADFQKASLPVFEPRAFLNTLELLSGR